jgi:hypothetical protein
LTFTLPYAGAIRIRFEGLPIFQALSLTLADTPSNDSTLNKALWPSQIRAAERLVPQELRRPWQVCRGRRTCHSGDRSLTK